MALQGTGSAVNGWSRPFRLTGANYPITLSAWVKLPAASTTGAGFFGLCGSNAMAYLIFFGANVGGANDCILDLYDDTGLESSGGIHLPPGRNAVFPADGNWHHIGARIITNVAPPPGGSGGMFWIDGARVSASPNGFNLGAQTFNTLQIGVAPTDGFEPAFQTNTALAEICVLQDGPAGPGMDSVMAALAAGASPLRFPGQKSLLAYHPLRGNFQDFGVQRTGFAPIGTPVQPVWVNHPLVDPAPLLFRRTPATHVAAAFVGISASVDTGAATLTNGVQLTGTGSSADSAVVNLLASSLIGYTQPTTDTGVGFLTSTPSLFGTTSSIDAAAGAFSTTQIPLTSTGASSIDASVGSLTVPSIAANCQQLQNALVDSLMRGQPFFVPGTWFIALVTQLGDILTPGTEVTGGGYVRASISASLAAWSGTQGQGTTQSSAGSSGLVSNNIAITYPTATTDWSTVVGYEFWDQPTGGNRWIAGKLGTALTVHQGDTRQFPPGSLSVAIG